MTISASDPAVPAEGAQGLEWHEGDMPYSAAFGDHFYCRTDGRLECGHVFLAGNGLPARWQGAGAFAIGELGFGTGLNFCETWRQWKATRSGADTLDFTSFELYPMRRADLVRALARFEDVAVEAQALAAAWPEAPSGHVTMEFGDGMRLAVVCGDALAGVTRHARPVDAWFLDGFAPARNPAMWGPELMAAIHACTRPGGSFATYAAAGFVRRNLVAAGFKVERRPGFAGKREMLCGIRD